MPFALEDLKTQLASTEQELEKAKATVYRCDGALQLLQHLIAEAEKPAAVEAAAAASEG